MRSFVKKALLRGVKLKVLIGQRKRSSIGCKISPHVYERIGPPVRQRTEACEECWCECYPDHKELIDEVEGSLSIKDVEL
jgi:hypothetical protein